ncbi:MAG: diaminopimelate decarboxylase, partial [Bacilli bacterium]
SWLELERLQQLGKDRSKQINVLLRLSPGIEAHTHEYILTGNEDSKFGFDLGNGDAKKAVAATMLMQNLNVLGVHVHIGSQIFETTGFQVAIQKVVQQLAKWRDELGFVATVFNVGGGFGIRYIETDNPLPLGEYVKTIVTTMKNSCEENDYPLPAIWTEPGRSIVGEAGTTLYTVGARKEIPGIRTYVSVDGGMTDNIRPALYEAEYMCALANRMNEEATETVSIAGKCCESGDMLIWDTTLPKSKPNDTLAVFSTGAYNYSMSSNYNRIARPAVVFVEEGESYIVVKRETLDQLILNDCPLPKQSLQTIK